MAELIQTHLLTPESLSKRSATDREQIYNILDSCVTLEVLESLTRLNNQQPAIYSFERALQAPILEIMLRGIRVDQYERKKAISSLTATIERLGGADWQSDAKAQKKGLCSGILQRYAFAIWGKPLNPRSPKQLQEFFYKHLHLPEIWISEKGVRKLSMNREVLEKLSEHYLAMPIVSAILTIREHTKSVATLETEIDNDAPGVFRMRTSLNIAATETGRLSSSKNAFGSGGNMQNWKERLRRPMVADPGWKMGAIDLEQAESREIGLLLGILFDDWTYLDAVEAGDLHTFTARLVWPELPWTGDLKADRKIAESPFYRDFSYRDMSKRGGHGCLTEEHEVLTRNGWVPITDKPEEIMIWKEGISRFGLVSHWEDKPYSGELQIFNGNSISVEMTHDHRVPFRADMRTGKVQERPAMSGPGRHMPLGDGFVGGMEVVPARLIAAFMADGHQKTTNRMEFHLRKERKQKRLRMLCERYNYEIYNSTDPEKFLVVGNLPKRAGAFMFNWTRECIDEFLDELNFWDGWTDGNHTTISSTRREELEWYQTLGRLRGIGGNIGKPRTSGFGSTVYGLQQNNRKWASGGSISWTKRQVENTRVLCPTVETGWFYVRRGGHIFVTGNTNYVGTPWTMARHLKTPVKVMEIFQERYFNAFPAIPRFHRWVAQELQTEHRLTTYFGRERHFFGRPDDDATLREAVAFMGQSPTADRMNSGLLKMWSLHRQRIRLLHQLHDAVYFQYRESDDENEVMRLALAACSVPIKLPNGRVFDVPGEAKVGWNMSKCHDPSKPLNPRTNPFNPDGLVKWKGAKDSRVRSIGMEMVL